MIIGGGGDGFVTVVVVLLVLLLSLLMFIIIIIIIICLIISGQESTWEIWQPQVFLLLLHFLGAQGLSHCRFWLLPIGPA